VLASQRWLCFIGKFVCLEVKFMHVKIIASGGFNSMEILVREKSYIFPTLVIKVTHILQKDANYLYFIRCARCTVHGVE
jgi:hypothetical protein